MRNILITILLFGLFSCSKYPANVKLALKQAGSNREELEKVFAHYSKPMDKLKLKAACDLIGTMPGKYHFDNPESDSIINEFCKTLPVLKKKYLERNQPITEIYTKLVKDNVDIFNQNNPIPDLSVISSEILIENIDMAFYVWENMPWAKNLSYEYFRDYILPFKTGHTKPELWRKKFFNQYKWVLDSISDESDPVEACTLINDELKSNFTLNIHTNPNNLSQIINIQGGNCEASSILALYAMRAVGIPVHITSTLISGFPPFTGRHSENIVLTKDLKFIRFQGSLVI